MSTDNGNNSAPKSQNSKEARITVRLYQSEYLTLQNKCKKLDITMANYVRNLINNVPLKSVNINSKFLNLLMQVQKMGVNLNQITRTLNKHNNEVIIKDKISQIEATIDLINDAMLDIQKLSASTIIEIGNLENHIENDH